MAANFQIKSKVAFYQLVGVGLIFIAVVALASSRLYPTLLLFGRSLNSSLAVVCGCSTSLSFSTNPLLTGGLLLGGLVIAFLAFYWLLQIGLMIYRTRLFTRQCLAYRRAGLSSKLRRAAVGAGLLDKVIEVDSGRPVLFCFGLLRPKICVDSLLVRRLQTKELRAALRHEQYHAMTREPMRLLVTGVVGKILFFVPGVAVLTDRYAQLSEIAADQFATDNFFNRAALARAFYKILAVTETTAVKAGLALSFFGLITEQRVNQLAGQSATVALPSRASRLSVLLFVGLCAGTLAALLALFNAPAHAGEGGGWCQNNQALAPTQCELIEIPACNISDSSASILCRNF